MPDIWSPDLQSGLQIIIGHGNPCLLQLRICYSILVPGLQIRANDAG
ncbi:MAG: hypothetical protein JWR02_2442 [Mucilaginibacter sp.]|nr:hypothetical protein [Mucilaginibacter sp.]